MVDSLFATNALHFRYTASAIASTAYNVPVPVVDGNVCRVLSRLKGIANNIKAPIFKDKLGWVLAEQLISANDGSCNPGEVNQALMELGATYCAPSGTGMEDGDPLKKFYLSTKLAIELGRAKRNGNLKEVLNVYKSTSCSCQLCDRDGVSLVITPIIDKLDENTFHDDQILGRAGHAALPTCPPKKKKREVYNVMRFCFVMRCFLLYLLNFMLPRTCELSLCYHLIARVKQNG